jgi:hypothetical protein
MGKKLEEVSYDGDRRIGRLSTGYTRKPVIGSSYVSPFSG